MRISFLGFVLLPALGCGTATTRSEPPRATTPTALEPEKMPQQASAAPEESAPTLAAPSVTPSPESIRRFGEVEWACDFSAGVFRRATAKDAWDKLDDGQRLPTLSGETAQASLVPTDDSSVACFVLDSDHAWVVVDSRERGVFVHRTSDGGTKWDASPLEGGQYTMGGPVSPVGSIRFKDAKNGTAETVDVPMHQNGHLEKRFQFVTRDGGRSWIKTRTTAKCHDAANQCRSG